MFIEPLRELAFQVNEAKTVAHEVGHEFGLDHAQGGLMSQSGVSSSMIFMPVSINLIRSRSNSPGEGL